jgi:hypothetical protein
MTRPTLRAARFAAIFWGLLTAFIIFDWLHSTPHDRFNEPPPWALNQPPQEDGGAHCSAPLKQ